MALVSWLLQPLSLVRAIYAPEPGNTVPVWTPLPGEPPTTTGAPVYGDADSNGYEDWYDMFMVARDQGQLAFWPGGTFHINGIEVSLAGQWHAAPLTDTDNDGLPDDIDDYPADPTNNSFYFAGGTFTCAGIFHAFRAGWYAGDGTMWNSGFWHPDGFQRLV